MIKLKQAHSNHESTLKIIENPDAKLFLEKFYSIKGRYFRRAMIELFMDLSAIMYFDFPLAVVN